MTQFVGEINWPEGTDTAVIERLTLAIADSDKWGGSLVVSSQIDSIIEQTVIMPGAGNGSEQVEVIDSPLVHGVGPDVEALAVGINSTWLASRRESLQRAGLLNTAQHVGSGAVLFSSFAPAA